MVASRGARLCRVSITSWPVHKLLQEGGIDIPPRQQRFSRITNLTALLLAHTSQQVRYVRYLAGVTGAGVSLQVRNRHGYSVRVILDLSDQGRAASEAHDRSIVVENQNIDSPAAHQSATKWQSTETNQSRCAHADLCTFADAASPNTTAAVLT